MISDHAVWRCGRRPHPTDNDKSFIASALIGHNCLKINHILDADFRQMSSVAGDPVTFHCPFNYGPLSNSSTKCFQRRSRRIPRVFLSRLNMIAWMNPCDNLDLEKGDNSNLELRHYKMLTFIDYLYYSGERKRIYQD